MLVPPYRMPVDSEVGMSPPPSTLTQSLCQATTPRSRPAMIWSTVSWRASRAGLSVVRPRWAGLRFLVVVVRAMSPVYISEQSHVVSFWDFFGDSWSCCGVDSQRANNRSSRTGRGTHAPKSRERVASSRPLRHPSWWRTAFFRLDNRYHGLPSRPPPRCLGSQLVLVDGQHCPVCSPGRCCSHCRAILARNRHMISGQDSRNGHGLHRWLPGLFLA